MINEQLEAIQVVCKSKGGIARHKNAKCVDVFGYCKHLPALFPQHGKGRKHTRPIVLEDWQRNLIDKHPWSFIKGLIHTDGCRYIQKQKYNQYVKYNFTNVSKDIIDIFTSSCDKLNLKYVSFCRKAEKQRHVSKWNIRAKNDSWIITINDRESVQLMDRHIGPKC